MPKQLTHFVFLFLFPFYLSAQNVVEDSLASELLKSKEDTNKVKTYYELIKIVRKVNPEKARKLAEEQLALSEKLGYKWGIGKAHNSLGAIANSLNLGDEALEHFKMSCDAFLSVRDYGNLSSTYSNISMNFSQGPFGAKYSNKIANDSAIYYARVAEKYNLLSNADRLLFLNNQMFIYGNLSSAYYNLNMHDSAVIYNNKSIEVAEQLNRYDIVATCYNALGTLFLLQKNYEKSIEYFLLALKLYEKEQMKGFVQIVKSDLALAYFNKGDIKRSREYLKQSQSYAALTGETGTMAQDYCTSGLIELYDNNIEAAINEFEKGLAIIGKYENRAVECQLVMGCAEAFARNKNYIKAFSMYDRALELSRGDYKATYDCCLALSSIYASMKNYEKAYKYLDEAHILNAKLFDSTKSQIINELTFKYETGKKDQQIVVLNKDREIQKAEVEKQKAIKGSIISAGTMIIVFSITGFVLYKRKRDANLKRKEAELNAHISDVEMKALRSQMNPHFIFNSLRSINEYIQHNKSSLASEYLISFAKLMRAILENSRKKEILISKEIEVLELYMQLEAQRMEHPFNYSVELDSAIDPENVLIPPMLLQPIVENSIWHGLAPKDKSGRIIIRIKKQNEMLQLEIEDDGVGREVSRSSNNKKIINSDSYGLKITEERLAIIEQVKKIKTNLVFQDLPCTEATTGLIVSFHLPYVLNM